MHENYAQELAGSDLQMSFSFSLKHYWDILQKERKQTDQDTTSSFFAFQPPHKGTIVHYATQPKQQQKWASCSLSQKLQK